MVRCAALLTLCLLSCDVAALEVKTLAVTRDRTIYHVVVDVLIDALPERVRTQLLDMQALPKLNPSVKTVRASALADGLRVESELEECFFGICRALLHVQQVTTRGNEIEAQTLSVPGSSFKSGIAHWQLAAEGQGTRLIFTADTEPDFWLPPFIGPVLVMQQLREKTQASLAVLEQLARE